MASRPNVVIIGGGIGGLFAANALIGQGLRVSVYEQASALGEVGAGVFVTPNAVRQLERVGLGPAVEKMGRASRSGLLLLSPRRYADRPGAGVGRLRLERDLWHAPRRLGRFPRCQPARRDRRYRPPRYRLRAERRRSPRQIRQRRHRRGGGCGCRRRNTLRTALLRFRPRSPSFTAPFLIEVWSRASACQAGRWTAGKRGPVRPSISWSSLFVTERWSTTSVSCRPMSK